MHRLTITLLFLTFIWPSVLFAQDERHEYHTITIDVSYPEWLETYPTLMETVGDYLHTVKMHYLLALSDAVLPNDRDLYLEITFEEIHHSDQLASIIFHENYDLGGLYPLDAIRTFTFDLENERELHIIDLFMPFADVVTVLSPFIERELGAEFLAENFALTEDALILLYPPARSGPTHAGMLRVEIPLRSLAGVLNPNFFGN